MSPCVGSFRRLGMTTHRPADRAGPGATGPAAPCAVHRSCCPRGLCVPDTCAQVTFTQTFLYNCNMITL
ncbi:hypothetical protein FKM82_023170 [Ascaphus truei]